MRRITTIVVASISAVVLMFSYHTSTMGGRAAASHGLVLASPDATVPSAQSNAPANDAPAATGADTGDDPTVDPITPDPATTEDPATTAQADTAPADTAPAAAAPKVVDGDSVDTRYGPVQVQVTVSGGKITDVQPLAVPYDNGRSQEINDYAVPILHQEIIDAQSAQIDTVSGATYTSGGYHDSLQSALDKIGFGS
jgi:uncharacterized protein with FMN-binding domain